MMCSTIESTLQCIGVELVLAGNLSYTGNARVRCAFGNFSIKVFSNLAFVPPPLPFNEIPHPSRLSTIEAKGRKKKNRVKIICNFRLTRLVCAILGTSTLTKDSPEK